MNDLDCLEPQTDDAVAQWEISLAAIGVNPWSPAEQQLVLPFPRRIEALAPAPTYRELRVVICDSCGGNGCGKCAWSGELVEG